MEGAARRRRRAHTHFSPAENRQHHGGGQDEPAATGGGTAGGAAEGGAGHPLRPRQGAAGDTATAAGERGRSGSSTPGAGGAPSAPRARRPAAAPPRPRGRGGLQRARASTDLGTTLLLAGAGGSLLPQPPETCARLRAGQAPSSEGQCAGNPGGRDPPRTPAHDLYPASRGRQQEPDPGWKPAGGGRGDVAGAWREGRGRGAAGEARAARAVGGVVSHQHLLSQPLPRRARCGQSERASTQERPGGRGGARRASNSPAPQPAPTPAATLSMVLRGSPWGSSARRRAGGWGRRRGKGAGGGVAAGPPPPL